MAKHAFGEGTVTLVTLKKGPQGKLEVARKFRVSGQSDVERIFPMREGRPVIGPLVYRELSRKELARLEKPANFKQTNYFECLVPAQAS